MIDPSTPLEDLCHDLQAAICLREQFAAIGTKCTLRETAGIIGKVERAIEQMRKAPGYWEASWGGE